MPRFRTTQHSTSPMISSFEEPESVWSDEMDGPSSQKSIAVYIGNTEKYIGVYILKTDM